jgi:hypothetical protein
MVYPIHEFPLQPEQTVWKLAVEKLRKKVIAQKAAKQRGDNYPVPLLFMDHEIEKEHEKHSCDQVAQRRHYQGKGKDRETGQDHSPPQGVSEKDFSGLPFLRKGLQERNQRKDSQQS